MFVTRQSDGFLYCYIPGGTIRNIVSNDYQQVSHLFQVNHLVTFSQKKIIF